MYTIGAFSKLCRISPRMLRHYDALGLLHPALVDPETGYRYYDTAQLERVERIRRLSAYGFPLAQVPELLALDADTLALHIRERRRAVCRELAELQLQVRRMEEELRQMERTAPTGAGPAAHRRHPPDSRFDPGSAQPDQRTGSPPNGAGAAGPPGSGF